MDRLPDDAFRYPATFRKVMDTKSYRAMMLHEQGRILACGYMWNIIGKSMGAGLWEVSLRRDQ